MKECVEAKLYLDRYLIIDIGCFDIISVYEKISKYRMSKYAKTYVHR